MTCQETRDLLPGLAGGELGPRERAACESHLATCAACAGRHEELRETVALLRRVGQGGVAESLPRGFSAALHLRLAQEPPPRPSLWTRALGRLEVLGGGPRVVLALGAAVALLVAVGGGWSALRGLREARYAAHPQEDAVAPFEVPQRRVAVVHLDFVTNAVVDDVEFEVTLPQGLAFVSNGKPIAQETLRWSGSLRAGSNPVPLAVSGMKLGRYRIVARARAVGLSVTHDVVLQVVAG